MHTYYARVLYLFKNTNHYIQEMYYCEAQLFNSQDKYVIQKACEIQITQNHKLVLHELDNENVWLYTAEK